jgi:hypothetical protein
MMMVFMLFGGFLLNKERVPPYCRWIAGASFFNYAYEVSRLKALHCRIGPCSIGCVCWV